MNVRSYYEKPSFHITSVHFIDVIKVMENNFQMEKQLILEAPSLCFEH